MTMKIRRLVIIDEEVHEGIRTEAFMQRRSMSSIYNELARKYLEKKIKEREHETNK